MFQLGHRGPRWGDYGFEFSFTGHWLCNLGCSGNLFGLQFPHVHRGANKDTRLLRLLLIVRFLCSEQLRTGLVLACQALGAAACPFPGAGGFIRRPFPP